MDNHTDTLRVGNGDNFNQYLTELREEPLPLHVLNRSITGSMTEDQIRSNIISFFAEYDISGNGYLELTEFQMLIRDVMYYEHGYSGNSSTTALANKIWPHFNQNGVIGKNEFLAVILNNKSEDENMKTIKDIIKHCQIDVFQTRAYNSKNNPEANRIFDQNLTLINKHRDELNRVFAEKLEEIEALNNIFDAQIRTIGHQNYRELKSLVSVMKDRLKNIENPVASYGLNYNESGTS